MKTFIPLALALTATLSLPAQNYYGAIDLAHRAVNKTEAASNQNPDAQPGQSAPRSQAPQPMDPRLQATLESIASLRADLSQLETNAAPAAGLTNDLAAAATGTKPSADTIARLAGDLQSAVAGKSALRAANQKFAQYLHAVANGGHLTAAQFQTVSDAVETILDNGGASYEATSAVLDDLKHLDRETQ
jgi:uncharacterized phage infection (PIP) family protein YhgE